MVSKNFKKLKLLPLSFICATHNRPKSLKNLISSISKNSFLPKEVIIVGTNINDFKMINSKQYKFKIKMIISPKKNQIFQRNLGINKSKNTLIIQSDDDVILSKNFIINLYKHFEKNKKNKKIVGAKILNSEKKIQSFRWNKLYETNIVLRFIFFVLNGFKKVEFMSILASGRIAPLLPINMRKNNKKQLTNLEWLSSTICYNKQLVKKINLSGGYANKKSYFEDVFFTHHNYLNGFNLVIDGGAICYHETTNPTNLSTHLKTITTQWKLVRLFNKSIILFLLDVIIFSTAYFISGIFKFLIRK